MGNGWGGKREGAGHPFAHQMKPSAEVVPGQNEQRALRARPTTWRDLIAIDVLKQVATWFMTQVVAEMAKGDKADKAIVAAMFREARTTAGMLAPYQHRRLAALQIQGDPDRPLVHAFDPASLDRLTEEQLVLVRTALALLAPPAGLPAPDNGGPGRGDRPQAH